MDTQGKFLAQLSEDDLKVSPAPMSCAREPASRGVEGLERSYTVISTLFFILLLFMSLYVEGLSFDDVATLSQPGSVAQHFVTGHGRVSSHTPRARVLNIV